MRISDWSSDVCSSDLQRSQYFLDSGDIHGVVQLPEKAAPRLYFDAQDFLAIFQETELLQPFIRLQRTFTPLRVMGKCFGPIGIKDRKSTRLNSVTNAHLVCRLLLEKKKN